MSRWAVVTTLAGGVSGTSSAFVDASGSNAGFAFPSGVAVDASGNVFVADSYNYRVRKVTAGGGTRIGVDTPLARLNVFDVKAALSGNRVSSHQWHSPPFVPFRVFYPTYQFILPFCL
jgi:hypothetical protein